MVNYPLGEWKYLAPFLVSADKDYLLEKIKLLFWIQEGFSKTLKFKYSSLFTPESIVPLRRLPNPFIFCLYCTPSSMVVNCSQFVRVVFKNNFLSLCTVYLVFNSKHLTEFLDSDWRSMKS